jgi:hypothetical protein
MSLYFALSRTFPATVSTLTHFVVEDNQSPRRLRVELDKGLVYLIAKTRHIAMLLIDEAQQAKRRQYNRIVAGGRSQDNRWSGGEVASRLVGYGNLLPPSPISADCHPACGLALPGLHA